jgi:hypothetical protein
MMSTGANCEFLKLKTGEWFYVLADWDCPRQAFDWYDYATAYGPFGAEEQAKQHLRDNHANPGGWNVEKDVEVKPGSTLAELIERAGKGQGKFRLRLGR